MGVPRKREGFSRMPRADITPSTPFVIVVVSLGEIIF